jgi:hypothetical protein
MRIVPTAFGAAAALIGLALQSGCETTSSEGGSLRVEPAAIGVRRNQQVEFTASGGFNYSWSLSDASLGFLTTATGPKTTYISRFSPGTNATVVIQTLTVTSTVGSSGPSGGTDTGTNVVVGAGFDATAQAIIEHLPEGDGGSAGDAGDTLEVSPVAFTFTTGPGETAAFTASGGSGSYSWSIGDPTFGTLSNTIGSSTILTLTTSTDGKSTVLVCKSDSDTVLVPVAFSIPPSP